MSYNIYKRNGYFYIKDNDSTAIYEGLSKNVIVRRETDVSTDFRFQGVKNFSESRIIPIAEIQDENGDAYTLAKFIKFYQEAGSMDVNLQDQTTPVIIANFSIVENETTLSSVTAIDDRTFDVADATGFAIGKYISIFSVVDNRYFLAEILSINVLEITVDTPLDFAFPIGAFVTSGNRNMNVNGSVTPVVFGIRNTDEAIGVSVDITRLIFTCIAESAVDLTTFGDIAGGLDRGIVVRKKDGVYRNIFNTKTNGGLANLMYDFNVESAANPQQGVDGFTCRFTFGGQNKVGVVIRLDPGEDLQLIISDDLTPLTVFSCIAEGHQVSN